MKKKLLLGAALLSAALGCSGADQQAARDRRNSERLLAVRQYGVCLELFRASPDYCERTYGKKVRYYECLEVRDEYACRVEHSFN